LLSCWVDSRSCFVLFFFLKAFPVLETALVRFFSFFFSYLLLLPHDFPFFFKRGPFFSFPPPFLSLPILPVHPPDSPFNGKIDCQPPQVAPSPFYSQKHCVAVILPPQSPSQSAPLPFGVPSLVFFFTPPPISPYRPRASPPPTNDFPHFSTGD